MEFMKELSETIGKIKVYQAFKDRLDKQERQNNTLSKPYMSLSDVCESIKQREAKITRFIETLTDNQITLFYLLFQAGSDIHVGTAMKGHDNIYELLYRHVDSDFNFSHTNNRQFKLSCFHDYLFTRNDAAQNVKIALKKLKE